MRGAAVAHAGSLPAWAEARHWRGGRQPACCGADPRRGRGERSAPLLQRPNV